LEVDKYLVGSAFIMKFLWLLPSGLEHIEEWWEETGSGPPIYTCRTCEMWGTSDTMFKHILTEKHRKAHLIHKQVINTFSELYKT
jgi:hypothetical protein